MLSAAQQGPLRRVTGQQQKQQQQKQHSVTSSPQPRSRRNTATSMNNIPLNTQLSPRLVTNHSPSKRHHFFFSPPQQRRLSNGSHHHHHQRSIDNCEKLLAEQDLAKENNLLLVHADPSIRFA